MSNPTSNQVRSVPNPSGKGGFGDNPSNINLSGHWKKEDTPRYKLEQMMKLSEEELLKVATDKSLPMFENKLAQAIIDGNWNIIKEMTEQVYGRAAQAIDVTTKGESVNPVTSLTADELRKLANN